MGNMGQAVPEQEAALVLSLNLKTLKHQRVSFSVLHGEGHALFLSAFLFKALGVGGNENKNKTNATATTFYGQRWS